MTYKLPEPIAWLHIHGNYTEAANRPLVGDEVGRGWCEAGLHTDMTVQAAYAAGLADGAPKWLPIESAPKDETEVLLMYMHIETQIVYNGFWLDDEYEPEESGWWSYDKSEVSRVKLDGWMTPTHWMPRPAAPEPKP